MACPQCCPEGPPRLAGPGWRLAPSLATPQAPLTWEERPRRLRGVPGHHPRNSRRAVGTDERGHLSGSGW
jgi:hypothetical protein